MPLKWERGKNPYTYNYFGKLGLGPNAKPAQIAAMAKKISQALESGKQRQLAGHSLDEHAISEASSLLREAAVRSEELLLVHPTPRTKGKLDECVAELRKIATIPAGERPLNLVHPLALFWFAPRPGPEAVELPGLAAFGLVGPADDEDLKDDIVFDF